MICKKCGTDIGDAKFCQNCGAAANGTPSAPPLQSANQIKKKKKVGCLPIVIGVVVFLLVVGALGGGNKDKIPATGSQDSTAQTEKPPEKPPEKTAKEKAIEAGVEVSWSELCKQYKDNAIAADATYKGKLLIVSGEIFDIGREVMQHPYVTFSRDGYFGDFQMVFNNDEEANIAKLSKDSTIKVVGECRGESIMTVLLDNCYLIAE